MRLWLIMMVLLGHCLAGCDFGRDAVRAEYVLPDGFRGVAVIRAHSEGAAEPRAEDGVVVLEFDEDGVCRIPGVGPNAGWYRPQARYRSGRVLPVIHDSISEEQYGGDLAVWQSVSLDNAGSKVLLVGHAQELERLWPRVQDTLMRHQHLPEGFFPCRIDDDADSTLRNSS